MMLCGVDTCICAEQLCVKYVGLSSWLLLRYEGEVRLEHDKSVSQTCPRVGRDVLRSVEPSSIIRATEASDKR